jgi:hypothetical protein
MTATLSTRVDDWIWTTLRSGVAAVSNRVYSEDTAPTNVTYPYIYFSLLSGLSVPVLEGARLLGRFVYIVQAVARSGNYDAVEAASDQIYTSLHQQTGAVAGIEILSSICEEEVRRAETLEGGTRFRYLGWRVRIEAISV